MFGNHLKKDLIEWKQQDMFPLSLLLFPQINWTLLHQGTNPLFLQTKSSLLYLNHEEDHAVDSEVEEAEDVEEEEEEEEVDFNNNNNNKMEIFPLKKVNVEEEEEEEEEEAEAEVVDGEVEEAEDQCVRMKEKRIFQENQENPENPENKKSQESQENQDLQESKQDQENPENQESTENQENKESQENKENQENKESQEFQENIGNQESQESTENQENQESTENQENQESTKNQENQEIQMLLQEVVVDSEVEEAEGDEVVHLEVEVEEEALEELHVLEEAQQFHSTTMKNSKSMDRYCGWNPDSQMNFI